MIDFGKLSDITYWFNPGPGDISAPYLYFFVIFFGFFVLLKILLRYMGRQYIRTLHKAQQMVFYKIENLFLTFGVLGLLWTFLRYELVSFFSARFWLAAWLAGFIICAYLIYYYFRYQVQEQMNRDTNRENQRRYTFSKRRR